MLGVFLRLVLRLLAVLVVLVLLVVAGGIANGWRLANARHPNPPSPLSAATDSLSLARGEHLARVVCAGCHTPGGEPPLSGSSEDFLRVPDGPAFGTMQATNLTPGGPLAHMTDGEVVRAIREGVGHDGRALLVMPSAYFRHLGDRDAAALVGWLRSQPAVDTVRTARRLNPLGYAVLGFRIFEPSARPPLTAPVADPPAGPSAGHGEYLSWILACRDCHGPDLRGGRKGQFPPVGPDLVALCAAHDVDAFDRGVREGISPTTGHALDPTRMPYPTYHGLDRVEVEALHAYLRSLGPGS